MKKIVCGLVAVVCLVPGVRVDAHHSGEFVMPRMSERRRYQLAPEFIERLAWCETHSNWKNGGNWAGGLGIARRTWIAFGGRQFAATPDRATKKEQIIVANRIALWGFTRRDGRFVYPVGLNGWGALGCASPARLIRRRIHRSVAFSAHETRDPYRTTP